MCGQENSPQQEHVSQENNTNTVSNFINTDPGSISQQALQEINRNNKILLAIYLDSQKILLNLEEIANALRSIK